MGEKLADKVYRSIRRDIRLGKLDSRTFLSEAQVAEKYGVSKAPARDALHLLTSQGYLVSYHRRGYMVNSYSVDELNQLQEIRLQLEKMAAKLVIERASDEQIEALRKIRPGQCEAPNHYFHLELAKLSGNKFLPDALEEYLHKLTFAKRGQDPNQDLSIHDRLVDALLARDVEAAYACLEADITFL